MVFTEQYAHPNRFPQRDPNLTEAVEALRTGDLVKVTGRCPNTGPWELTGRARRASGNAIWVGPYILRVDAETVAYDVESVTREAGK